LGGPREEGVGGANGAAERRIRQNDDDDDDGGDDDDGDDPRNQRRRGAYLMPSSEIEGVDTVSVAVFVVLHAASAVPSSDLDLILVSFALPPPMRLSHS